MGSKVESTRRFRVLAALRSTPQPYCQVCFGPETRLHVVHDRHSQRKITVRVCVRCGYVELPDNTDDGGGAVTLLASSARREREMAKLGVDILDRSDPLVLCLGQRPDVVNQPYPIVAHYDVVVAADVIDRFEDPRREFARIFNLLSDEGILICSSTLHDGGPLGRCQVLFGGGRGSYYTAQSLRRIAAANGLQVDFRWPPPNSRAGARRRYVLFSPSEQVLDLVADYFARHHLAPSRQAKVKRRREDRREVGRAGGHPTALG
jgi:hypothetical protein